MIAPLHLEQVKHLPTRWIYTGNTVVGFLYSPDAHGDEWEIWPRSGCFDFFANWPADRQLLRFKSLSDAEAYLGIRREQEAA